MSFVSGQAARDKTILKALGDDEYVYEPLDSTEVIREQGVFQDPLRPSVRGARSVQSKDPTLTVSPIDVPNPRRDDLVAVDGRRFSVRSHVTDEAGLYLLKLQELKS